MFAGMDWPCRERLLDVMADAGVLWLQLTGGEPLIDPLFAETHARAWDMGMMIMISSNGSRLDQPRTLDLLTARRPYQLALSLYGATEESYDGMTRRQGSFRRFMRGLAAAHEAGLPMRTYSQGWNNALYKFRPRHPDHRGLPLARPPSIEVPHQIYGHLVPSSFDRARAALDTAYQSSRRQKPLRPPCQLRQQRRPGW